MFRAKNRENVKKRGKFIFSAVFCLFTEFLWFLFRSTEAKDANAMEKTGILSQNTAAF